MMVLALGNYQKSCELFRTKLNMFIKSDRSLVLMGYSEQMFI